MAIDNATAAVAGLSLSSGLVPITGFTLAGLFKVHQSHASGEMPMIELLGSGYNNLEIRADASGLNKVLRVSKSSGSTWEQLDGTVGPFESYFGLGISCSGVGAGALIVCYATGPTTYTSIPLELGGSTWTPTALRLLHGTLIAARGCYGEMQNVKYGANALTAAQMAQECWNLTVQYGSDWTPLVTKMTSGTVATQAGTLTVVNSGSLAASSGPLAEASGTPPTIAITSVTPLNATATVVGTFTSLSGGTQLSMDAINGSTTVYTVALTPTGGGGWTATLSNIDPGTYLIRVRVIDGGGTATADSTLTMVGLSGEDEIPYTYPTTGILAVPTSATIPAGSTAVFKATNQAGTAIAGAVVGIGNSTIATAPTLTDESGNVVVTGVSAGMTNLVLSVMNIGGAFLNAQVPLTIGTGSVTTVTITPKTVAMFINQTQQFTSVISGGGTTLWTVESGSGSIDGNGLYTAPATATSAVIRATKSGFPATFDESTVAVSAGTQQGIGAAFLGDANVAVAPGQSFSWRIKVLVDGQAFAGAQIAVTAVPDDLLAITQPLPTSADGTTTVVAQVASDIDTGISTAVTFAITAGTLSMQLTATVSITDSEFGYLVLRGRSYPRTTKQN